ncbi:MAG: thiamine phosphate synthase [Parabacteroides sp.]|nr:thiamine phosphate synthase [Parabacteroides sp.]
MPEGKKLIAISLPRFFPGEAEAVGRLLDAGLERFHLRKPESSAEEISVFLHTLPPVFYPKIVLHDCFALAKELGLKGIHLNRRNSTVPAGFQGSVSRSCHATEELEGRGAYDYVFLSPVFDSVSKAGYGSRFTGAMLRAATEAGLIDSHVIALGGMDCTTLPLIEPYGFGGAAVLGALWQDYAASRDTGALLHRFYRLRDTLNKSSK